MESDEQRVWFNAINKKLDLILKMLSGIDEENEDNDGNSNVNIKDKR